MASPRRRVFRPRPRGFKDSSGTILLTRGVWSIFPKRLEVHGVRSISRLDLFIRNMGIWSRFWTIPLPFTPVPTSNASVVTQPVRPPDGRGCGGVELWAKLLGAFQLEHPLVLGQKRV